MTNNDIATLIALTLAAATLTERAMLLATERAAKEPAKLTSGRVK